MSFGPDPGAGEVAAVVPDVETLALRVSDIPRGSEGTRRVTVPGP